MMDLQREPVGMIGLGLLGSAMSEQFLQAGRKIIGFDIDSTRREQLQSAGGISVSETERVARSCPRILLSLPTSEIAQRVVKDLLPNLVAGQILIDTTTGHPDEMSALATELSQHGVQYFDATIAGSSEQVRQREVIVLVGGDAHVLEQCRDLLEIIAKKVFAVGPCGSGARMKLVVNLVLGLHRAVLAEGLSFAESLGFDPTETLQILQASPAQSVVMQTKGTKMVQRDFTPQARLSQHLKDVRLMLDLAQQHRLPLPLSQLHEILLNQLVERGEGDLDNSAIIKLFDTAQ